VIMALQNHSPLIRNWKDCYDLVKEVNSPWLQFCLDLPNMHDTADENAVQQAVQAVGRGQVHSHFGGEYYRDAEGCAQPKALGYGSRPPDYGLFLRLLRQAGYDGNISFELCHPVLNEAHEYQGLEYVDQQAQLAQEYMQNLFDENLP